MIICKSPAEIEKLRRSGRIVREVLEELRDRVKPGMTTLELEKYTEKRLAELRPSRLLRVTGAIPAVCAPR